MKTVLIFLFVCSGKFLFSQGNWTYEMKPVKALIKNEGQFDNHVPGEKIEYGFRSSSEHFFFTGNKIHIHLRKVNPHQRTDEEIRERAERKNLDFKTFEEWEQFQKAGRKLDLETDVLVTEWIGANPDAVIVPSEENTFTHGFLMNTKNGGKSIDGVKSYNKITYKDIYPNIDIEYTLHPICGIKYSVIIHPGGNPADVKLSYSKNPFLHSDGTISTSTKFGAIVDYAPVTFYQSDERKINSSYVLNQNTISFSIANYDSTETIIVDPWTATPTFATNWDCVWECETDAAGNVYFIGGADNLELRKFNAAGTQQWSYTTPYDTSSWLGTMVTDNNGNTFVTQGSVAAMIRVSTAGALAWSVGNVSGQLSGEFWNIALNCDQTRLVTAGTGGGIPPQPYIYDINPANGANLGSIQVTQSSGLFNIEEVRSITATENEKYYWLTHDSIGYVSQIFNICPSYSTPVKTITGYNMNYKCENWRYNNTGIEAIAYYGGYAYVNRGTILDKRDFATGASVGTVAIPGGGWASSQVQNSGIAIDNCGNIFVGSKLQVVKFNTSLTQLATYATSFNVYDVAIGTGGQVIACGSLGTGTTASRVGYIQSITGGACVPYAMVCCNATVCNPGPLCVNDAPITLVPEETGGTWSSTAPGFNTTTGVFDPSVAGVGSYTITYTLPCGSSTLTITVIGCVAMTMCLEANGNVTVTGGTGPYTWAQPTHTSGCGGSIGPGCGFFDQTVVVHAYTNFGTGTTVTPPAGADTIRVTDAFGEVYTTYNYTTLPACSLPLPVQLISFEGERISDEEVLLNWHTASEINNSHFTIHRSDDGEFWKFIRHIPGAGTSSQTHSYHLNDICENKPVVYYRLSQTNHDGELRSMSVISVTGISDDALFGEIFPNPANTQTGFIYNGDSEKPMSVVMYNALGETVKSEIFTTVQKGQEIFFKTDNLPSGIYQLVCQQGGVSKTEKIIISK